MGVNQRMEDGRSGSKGRTRRKGRPFSPKIYECVTRPKFVCRHDWQGGYAVLGDNGLTMHRREPFRPVARRLMKRTTIFLSRERHIVPAGRLIAEWCASRSLRRRFG
jgi:hypothetical protein